MAETMEKPVVSKGAQNKLRQNWEDGKFLCIGLDPVLERIPRHIQSFGLNRMRNFLFHVISNTIEVAAAFKPNCAFFERFGWEGISLLQQICDYITDEHPGVFLILDAKRADIGNTNEGYAEFVFDRCGADAVTINPYFGKEAMEPFLRRKDKISFVLCKTSNKGSDEFQNDKGAWQQRPLYERVAANVAREWNVNKNCGLVAGATYPNELRIIRENAPDLPLLIPGVGTQGGDLISAVKFARTSEGGFLINSSSAIIYASSGCDYDEAVHKAAQKLNNEIKDCLRAV